MPKRPRPSSSTSHKAARHDKHSSSASSSASASVVPMPDPPPSLVQLLQKDPKVLHYFQSLQTNLNRDVQKWKERAMEYKAKYDHVRLQPRAVVSQPSVLRDTTKQKKKKGSRGQRSETGNHDERVEVCDSVEGDDGKQPDVHEEMEENVVCDKNDETIKKGGELPRSEKECEQEDDNSDDLFDQDFFAAIPSDDSSEDSSSSKSLSSRVSFTFESEGQQESKRRHHVIEKTKDEKKVLAVHGKDGVQDIIPSVAADVDAMHQEREELKIAVQKDLYGVLEKLKKLGVSVVDLERKQEVAAATSEASVTVQGDMEGTTSLPGTSNVFCEMDASDINSGGKVETLLWKEDSDDDDSESSNEGFLSTEVSASQTDLKNAVVTEKPLGGRWVVHRRSDEDVILDIMRSLRSLIRKPALEMARIGMQKGVDLQLRFQPFPTQDWNPVCYDSCHDQDQGGDASVRSESYGGTLLHPLVEGLQILIEALIVIDQLCGTDSIIFSEFHEDWEQMRSSLENSGERMSHDGDEWEKIESMRIGLRDRNISQMILASLHGEIVKHWPGADRATREDSKLSDDMNEDDDGDEDDKPDEDFGSTMMNTNRKEDDQDNKSATESSREIENRYRFNTKNQTKLFMILERVCLARIVTCLYQSQGDYYSGAQVVFDYILHTTPSMGIEDYPAQAPVLSFLVLEALLKPLSDAHSNWFDRALSALNDTEDVLQQTLCYLLHSIAEIWKQRECSSNPKIRGISSIEISAYKRLLQSQSAWFCSNLEPVSGIRKVYEDISDFCSNCCVGKILSLQLILSWDGDLEQAKNFVVAACRRCNETNVRRACLFLLAVSCVLTYVRLQQLMWETRCSSGLSVTIVRNLIDDDTWLESQFHGILASYENSESTSAMALEKLKLLLRWCAITADGSRAYELAKGVCCKRGIPSIDVVRALNVVAELPLVRVINLKHRVDRWKQFRTQAQKSQVLLVLGVASISSDKEGSQQSSLWGLHAHDGRDVGHLGFEQQVSTFLEEGKDLNDYVASHWRPSNLIPFDVHARSDNALVRASVSERACALSHISSWYGVKNSILELELASDGERILQLFRISGFACGEPFLRENRGMPPSPVCVILEDDAMLVDQFHDRLAQILKELPRDFHFCSLGYSRPKNAPMIHYSKNIGIPTCFWYLTGYILSLEGVKYLLNSLPVQGPVDSWIGMKATANWENEYGRSIGVGTAPKAKVHLEDLKFKRKLGAIVKFRVFAALTPLCSQKLAWKDSVGISSDISKWRQRDTDITFSGRQ